MNPPEDQLGDGIDIWVYGESTDQNSKKEPYFHFCKDKIGKGHKYAIDIEVKIRDIEKMSILRSKTGNLTWDGLHIQYKKVLKWLNQKAYDADLLNKEAIRQEWNRCNMSNRVKKEEL